MDTGDGISASRFSYLVHVSLAPCGWLLVRDRPIRPSSVQELRFDFLTSPSGVSVPSRASGRLVVVPRPQTDPTQPTRPGAVPRPRPQQKRTKRVPRGRRAASGGPAERPTRARPRGRARRAHAPPPGRSASAAPAGFCACLFTYGSSCLSARDYACGLLLIIDGVADIYGSHNAGLYG
jgi:hypothetical protein